MRDRLNGGQHDGKVLPIALLEKDSYQHGQHGRVRYAVLDIVDWMSLTVRRRHRRQRRVAAHRATTSAAHLVSRKAHLTGRGWPRGPRLSF